MNRLNLMIRLSSVAMLLAASAPLVAQASSAQFNGTVTKANGQPLPEATVILRAPQLIGGAKTVRTDEQGRYRVPLLPPGDYSITVTAQGYRSAKNDIAIRLGVGEQKTQNFSLKPIELQETTVTVVASTAVADKSDPKVSVNFSAEQLAAIPTTNRSFEGALNLTPGAVSGPAGFGTASIRGGKSQTAVYTLNGATVGEDVSGMSPNGQSNTSFVEDAIEDTEVVTSGLHGRYGRSSGGSINVATKSGGNEFSGSIRKYISRNDWNALRPGSIGQNSMLADDYENRKTDIVISGPILKDKIWFFASAILAPTTGGPFPIAQGTPESDMYLSNVPTKFGLAWAPGTTPISPDGKGQLTSFDMDKGFVANPQTSSKFYQGKLTWAITSDHVVAIERVYNNVKTKNDGFNEGGTMASVLSYRFDSPTANTMNNLTYKGVLAGNLFVEANVAEKTWTHLNGPQVPFPHVRYYTKGMGGGMIWPYGTNLNALNVENNANKQGGFNFKYITDWKGQHEFDFGYQYYESLHYTSGVCGPNQERFYIYGATKNAALLNAAGVTGKDIFGGSVGFLAANWDDQAKGGAKFSPGNPGGSGIAPTYRKYIGADGAHRNRNEGFYINDVWTINSHWTLMGALRIEKIRDTDTDGTMMIKFTSDLSPRFSVKYDINGDSAHVLSFSTARFTEDITAGTTNQFVKSPGNNFVNYGWNANPTGVVTWTSYDQLTNPKNYGKVISQVSNTVGVVGLDGIRNPYIVETTAGYRRSRQNGSTVGFSLVYKQWYNDFVQMYSAYDRATWVDVQLDPKLDWTKTLAMRVANSNDLTRAYKAFEMDFREVVSDRFSFGGSYTYSRLTGNDDGGDMFNSPFKSSGLSSGAVTWATQYYNFRDALLANGWDTKDYAPHGLLMADQTHKLRLHFTYTQPLGKDGKITYSLMGRYDSGYTWSARSGNTTKLEASDNLSPWTVLDGENALLLPPGAPSQVAAASFAYYSDARGGFRVPDSHQLDFKIDFLAPIGVGKAKLMGNVMITNVLNKMMLTSYDNTLADANGAITPDNRMPLRVNNPAIFGTGFKAPGVYDYKNFLPGRSFSASLGLKF